MTSNKSKQLIVAGACLLVLGGTTTLRAQANDADKISQLEKQNQDLQKRLAALEDLAQKNGLAPSGDKAGEAPVSALTAFGISGFVTTSFFHDSSEPSAANGHVIPGYLWNRVNDNFSLNKVKLTFASAPVEQSGDKFDVAYRASFIAGQDAPIVNSKSGVTGFDYLREAYLEMNVPVGTGLNIKAGELISLLNYESGDGGAANNNFSQGFQWFFTGNGPAAGVQAGYNFCDQVGAKIRVQNGLYAGPIDNNNAKTVVASINLKPCNDLWVTGTGFVGREDVGFAQDVYGAEVLAGYNVTSQLNFGTELDYFNFYQHDAPTSPLPGHNSVYSGGLWSSYWFVKELGLAVRAEYLSDKHGVDISGGALGLMNPVGTGQDITSVALTLNYLPISRIKIQPEIRWDHTSWSHGWDPVTPVEFSKQNRFIYGIGASYLF